MQPDKTTFETSDTSKPVRIHAYLAQLGLGSRREVESVVEAGKVMVNGKKAVVGQKVTPGLDTIKYRSKLVSSSLSNKQVRVYILHKPRGVVTTASDPFGRVTVMDLIPKRDRKKVFPVGRLDLNSEGLLLLTNDGELSHRLMHPSFEVSKVYEVKIRGNFTEKKIDHIRRGVMVENKKYKPAEILELRDVTSQGVKKFVVKIRVNEGKNHHVRKLFEALSCRVVRLKRLSIASLTLKGIPLGEARVLEDSRVKRLQEDLGIFPETQKSGSKSRK